MTQIKGKYANLSLEVLKQSFNLVKQFLFLITYWQCWINFLSLVKWDKIKPIKNSSEFIKNVNNDDEMSKNDFLKK